MLNWQKKQYRCDAGKKDQHIDFKFVIFVSVSVACLFFAADLENVWRCWEIALFPANMQTSLSCRQILW
jgi:formate hydrogenlyase subunit 3/multisubunit Na+/H+ antiporter MnhD subunit